MRFLFHRFAVIFVLIMTVPAGAETLSDLVEERAREAYGLQIPQDSRIAVSVMGEISENVIFLSDFRMNPVTGQFIAEAILESGASHRFSGLASPMVSIPAPVRALPAGTILGEGDITMIEIHASRVNALAAVALSEIIGMEARRHLAQGRPVMRQALGRPLVVRRGDIVTLHYRSGALDLSVSARAMTDAHAGQGLRVVNLASKSLVQATAVSEGTVEVTR